MNHKPYSIPVQLFLALTLLPIAMLSSSCAPENAWNDEAPAPQIGTPLLAAKVIPQDEPNTYAVSLSWNASGAASPNLINRTDERGVCRIYSIKEGSTAFLDTDVKPGMGYRYETQVYVGTGATTQSSVEVQVAKDLVIDPNSQTRIDPNQHYARLFLKGRVNIPTDGQPFSLDVDELFSEDATINTSAVISKSSDAAPGSAAGDVKITAKRAHGSLKIIANGQDGGDGTEGAKGATGAPGTPGVTARLVPNPAFYGSNPENLRLKAQALAKVRPSPENLLAVNSMFGEIPSPARITMFTPAGPTVDGGRGQDGARGGDGGDGGRGGASGIVSVTVAEDCDFVVDIQNEPGRGGRAGAGGIGGDGGAAGAADAPDGWGVSRTAVAGLPGSRGPEGRPGRQGDQGVHRPNTVQIGARVHADAGSNTR